MKRESESERNERLTREESAKWRRSAAKERIRQNAIAHIVNSRKTDEERKRDAEFEDAMIGKNATLNEREAFRGALTSALINEVTKNETAIRYANERSDYFVERWTGKKYSKKESTERTNHE